MDKICELIKKFEGLRLRAYQDAVGVWTIGYGHTGSGVHEGLEITKAQADFILRRDVEGFVEEVDAHTSNIPLTENQHAAVVSLAFNVGVSAFAKSTLLKKLKAGDLQGAADQFLRWTRAGGKVLPGLVSRREAERKLFLTE